MHHIPYTYLIGWSKHDLYYYGVRTARGCTPDDLWVKYFTSSNYVNETRTRLGEPDVISIRKTFSTPEKAINWENKVLKRMKAHKNIKFINKTNNKACVNKKEHYVKLANLFRGKKKPEIGKLISSKFTKSRREASRKILQNITYRKIYKITCPDNSIIIVEDLKKFSIENKLSYTSLSSLANGKWPCSTYKGYKAVPVGTKGIPRIR